MVERRAVDPVAIIGMAGKFPGAEDVKGLWENLRAGRDSIRRFSDEELAAADYALHEVQNDPGFVKARGVLEGVELFDAAFFGFRPREAAALDPQQRLWFECAWQALEDAGVAPGKTTARIGVFAGGGYLDTYLLHNLCPDRDSIERLVRLRSVDAFQNIISNDKDFLPTRTSHLFGLTGPSVNVQTACSTSLVAVVMAAQSLMLGESDVCIAGGVSIQLPQVRGYLAQEGGMDSFDGYVRPFDGRANGTVFGNGLGVVVLKRLEDALRDGDRVLAVLKGYALNNDGAARASYIAPSLEGQMGVVRRALEVAGISADQVSYVEAHGTGTSVGDPVEVEALARVYREQTERRGYCGIGSIKSNIGHLDSAAGVAGLIKTVLAMQHGEIPATIHFRSANPKIDFDSSPFFVVKECLPWPRGEQARVAAVSSFGVGGTNAHVIVADAPGETGPGPDRPWQLLTLSARSAEALEERTTGLADHLAQTRGASLESIAFSLLTGREDMPHRRFLLARDRDDALSGLRSGDPQRLISRLADKRPTGTVFMFPGQGAQHVGMGQSLYASEPAFRDALDECAALMEPHLGEDLRAVLYPGARKDPEEAARELTQTRMAQPALFAVEYSLARLWMSWGLEPDAMIGHSVGDFVAACLAGVFDLRSCTALLAARGSLMQAQPPGVMLAVRCPAEEVRSMVDEVSGVYLAACNAPALCVVSGEPEAMQRFEALCSGQGFETRFLHTSHAFHSGMMTPVMEPFREAVANARPRPPARPFVSSRTGLWISDQEATSPDFWAEQLTDPVLFHPGLQALLKTPGQLFIEVGPGTTLAALARQGGAGGTGETVLSTLGHANDQRPARGQMLECVGRLWLAGGSLDWPAIFNPGARRRVPLPAYPFQKQRYWVDPPSAVTNPVSPALSPELSQENPMTPVTPPAAVEPNPPSRLPRVRAALAEVFEEFSGIDIDAEGSGLTFLDLGFDSLFLTQIATALQNRFGIRIRFRRMLEDLCTLDRLAEFFDGELPAKSFVDPAQQDAPSPVQPEAPVPVPATTSHDTTSTAAAAHSLPAAGPQASGPAALPADISALERIVHQQLILMQQQLALVGGGGAVPPLAAAAGGGAAPVGLKNETLEKGRVPEPAVTSEPSSVGEPRKPKAFGAQARIDTSTSETFSPRQQECFDRFVERYVAKTIRSKEFTQKYRRVMSDPRVVTGFRPIWKEIVYPIVVDRSKGAKLWDLDGNEYVDLTCGFGSNFLGNQPEFIAKAVHEQVELGYEVGPQHPLTAEVSLLISELTGMERVAFCNTGSEAVMGAMRAARTITGRSLIAIFSNSYHGIFDEVIVRGTKSLRSIAAAPGILASAVENVLVLEYGSPESLEILRKRGPELAAIMAEPVQSRNPAVQPREFLHELRKIADDCGSALIFDEVITGFRIAPGGAQEYFGVRADLATYGKIIGGGLPLAAIAGNERFMDALDGGYWQFGDDSYPEVGVTYFAGTFVRHPLALAAARASLIHLKEQGPDLQRKLNEKTTWFVKELRDLFQRRKAAIRIDQFGSLCRLVVSEEEPYGSLLYYWLRDHGVHIWEGFGTFLTTAHSMDEIRHIIRAFDQSVAELQESGLLSGGDALQETVSAIPDESGSGEIPMTDSQREIWHASQMGQLASCSYNEAFTLDLAGSLDEQMFHEAVDLVSSRHEALHLRFDPEGRFQFRVQNQAPPLPVTDWMHLDEAGQRKALSDVLERHATEPFDLVNGPLIRNGLYRLGPDRWVFVSVAHHIVFDGWSAGVYLDEIGQAYSALIRGESPDLPRAPAFSEYASNEVKLASSGQGREADRYWSNVFKEPPEPLHLPTDRVRPARRSYAGASVHWEFAADTYELARRAAARNGTTLYSLLLATFASYLRGVTGQEDLVVGIPAAGQALVGEYSLIGHCVNILPVRLLPGKDQHFTEFLSRTANAVLDAQDHQPATLGGILRSIRLPRTPGRSPLVEVIFNLNRKLPGEGFGDLKSTIHEVKKRAINWDMFFNCSEEDGRLTTDLDYSTELFDESTIRRWLEGLENLLRLVSEDSAIRLGDLPLVTPGESKSLLALGRGKHLPLPDVGFVDLFSRQASLRPDQIAVEWGGTGYTYADLQAASDRVASSLRAAGVERGVAVGVALARSPALLAALLGVMKAGGHYVPLDPVSPQARLAHIVKDARLRVFLVDGDLPGLLQWAEGTFLHVDEAIKGSASPASGSWSPPELADAAYVIYTSGSTGAAKGVRVSHGALASFLVAMQDAPGLGADDALLAVTTLSFDIAALELYLPLLVGARLRIVPADVAEDPGLLAQALEDGGITVMQATPTHWQLLLESGWRAGQPMKALVGGEALPRGVARSLMASCSEVWNMYGPTETTIWSACQRLTPENINDSVPIGAAIANTRLYLLDAGGRLVPRGAPGELWIGGPGVSDGYPSLPDLAAERFRDDPFAGSGRMYNTGDFCRWRADGLLEFLGRKDQQVKIRGFRVELGDVESALSGHPGVAQAVAARWEPIPGDARLVGYLVPSSGSGPSAQEMRAFLLDRLPEYMVPQNYVVVTELPRTPNGKIDRQRLPDPGRREGDAAGPLQPTTPVQRHVHEVWRQVLGTEAIGIHDDFFDLGGHSVLATRILTTLRRELEPALTLRQLFEATTVAELSAEIEALRFARDAGQPGNDSAQNRERLVI